MPSANWKPFCLDLNVLNTLFKHRDSAGGDPLITLDTAKTADALQRLCWQDFVA